MSDFQKQLDQEIEQGKKPESGTKKLPRSLFSFGAFTKGLIVGGVLFAGLLGFAAIKSSDTADTLQARLASKTTIVEEDAINVFRISEAQPVLKMPHGPAENTEHQASEEPAQTENKPYTGKGLVPAPIPGLYESAGEGLLPKARMDDGLTPFEAYKRPFQKKNDKPLLSFVVTDLGLSQKVSQSVINNFAADISLAFSPYGRNLKPLTDAAREKGHEVWLTLPLETADFPAEDPGPSTLLVNASVEQNQGRLVNTLARTQGYVGFISQKDHIFKREDSDVNPAIQQIFSRGLAILDGNTYQENFIGYIAAANNYPHGKNNFWLDDDLSPEAIDQALKDIAEYGKARGHVIVMLHPYPASLKAVQKFLNSPTAQDFQLAPASTQMSYGG